MAETNEEGHRRLQFSGTPDISLELDRLGEVPLPPYIERQFQLPEDKERYQTVYAKTAGSVAAPTAGLHFTPELLEQIRARGVQICFVTLHVGAGTFLPVKTETLAAHKMHEERFELSEEAARNSSMPQKIPVAASSPPAQQRCACSKPWPRGTMENSQKALERRAFSYIRHFHSKPLMRC